MEKKTILLLHGFASSAGSAKSRFFGEKLRALSQVNFHAFDFNPTSKDFEYMTITGMINRLRQHVLDHNLGDVSIIGSSLGALVGLHYAHRFGGVKNMLLLAPALVYWSEGSDQDQLLRWQQGGVSSFFHFAFEREVPLRYDFHVDGLQYVDPVPPPASIIVVHGRDDDVIPIENSRRYCASFPEQARLIEVDSDHRLNDQLPSIWGRVQSLILT
jgi:pimeloyl-ACP methyl ester carboxylesterase